MCLFVSGFIAASRDSVVASQIISSVGALPPAKLGGSGDSGLSVISPNGRYILFASLANNLALANNYNLAQPFRCNVFLRDTVNHITTLVSVNQSGTGGGNGDSFPTGISTNGQFALFESSASNLAANDTNNASDVFVRDLINGTTTLASVSLSGGVAIGGSRGSVLTPDGRYVAFIGTASNLVAGDSNNIPDVFVRDLQAGTTTWVSPGSTPTNASTRFSSSESPEITPDGRYVAFYSTATNLIPTVKTAGEIYVRDLVAGKTIWASTNARAIFASVTGSSNCVSCNYSISADGQFAAFEVCSNSQPTSTPAGIILRYSLLTGLTDIINTKAFVPRVPFEFIHDLSMSPDGRFVAYVAGSFTTNSVYLWDAQSDSNTLVSVSLDNATPANGISDAPVISLNGQFVAFLSSATNLVTNTLSGGYHFYLRDLQAGVTQLLDADTNGVGVGVDPTVVPAISADGGVVVFDCANLLPDNRHQIRDVFIHTVATGANDLVSASQPGLMAQTPNGSSGLTPFGTSSNGLFVAFYSDSDNLVPNDTNGCSDVFVRDLAGGTTILVSVNTNGNASGAGVSTEPAISGDGRYVAFTSRADNLVSNATNGTLNVYFRDLQAGTTALVSVSTDGIHPGNGDSFSPILSADGRHVLFHSKAANLATGSFGTSVENLFFRDLQTGITYPLTASGMAAAAMTPDGQFVAFGGTPPGTSGSKLYVWNSQTTIRTYTNSASVGGAVAISPDGQKLAYVGSVTNVVAVDLAANTLVTLQSGGIPSSHPGLGFSKDGRFLTYAAGTTALSAPSIYLYDFQSGSNALVSQNFNATGAANASSDSSTISPDARFIAYRSLATNLVPFDFNNVPDLFVYDTANNATILVSVSDAGNSSAADRSLKPVFSGDSQSLFFQSWAPDMTGNDFNNGGDIFALNLAALPWTGTNRTGATNAAAVFYVQLVPAGIFNSYPTLTWPLAAGNNYQVQFKTNLTDSVWQNLPGSVAFVGDSSYVSDPTPAVDQRFYRVVSSP